MKKYREEELEELKKMFSKNIKYPRYVEFPNLIIDLDKFLLRNELEYDGNLTFSVYGCSGLNKEQQIEIAACIKNDNSIKFNLLLGNNICQSAKDGDLHSFCILGSHDYNYMERAKEDSGPDVALKQVIASYAKKKL